MDKLDNQADGFKEHEYLAPDEDPLQIVLARAARTLQQDQALRSAVDADFGTGMAGDE
jgi:hypothetical protein